MFTAKNREITEGTSEAEELNLICDDDEFIPAFGKLSGDNLVERYFQAPPRLQLHHHQKVLILLPLNLGQKH